MLIGIHIRRLRLSNQRAYSRLTARSFAGKQSVKIRATARSSHAVQIHYDHLLHEQRGSIAQISSRCCGVTLTLKTINSFSFALMGADSRWNL
jgi:hypothetical protein